MRDVLIALAVGSFVTSALLVSAAAADHFGAPALADALFWQNGLLQHLAPLHNIGTPEHPVYEGTPINFLTFIASIPFGVLVYGGISYLALRHRRSGA